MSLIIQNYSRGWIVERVPLNRTACSSWLLLPAENLWPEWLRATLYLFAMLYVFLGIAIASDVFMSSIEWITATKRKVVIFDPERGEQVSKEVYVWNETVANLTLMALGSSAPEILLAIGEGATGLSDIEAGRKKDSLGLFTILGSAAFNLLVITGICIISVPSPEPKRIKELGVFIVTGISSLWAYVWMLVVVVYVSPHVIEPWEAWLTFAFFPIMVVLAYCQDNGWWLHKCTKNRVEDNNANVRVVSGVPSNGVVGMPQGRRHSHVTGVEIQELERQQKSRRGSQRMSFSSVTSSVLSRIYEDDTVLPGMEGSKDRHERQRLDRTKFRHAAVKALRGNKKSLTQVKAKPSDSGQVSRVSLRPDAVDDNLGRFAFSSSNYSVLESAGSVEVEVLFNRRHSSLLMNANLINTNGSNIGARRKSASPNRRNSRFGSLVPSRSGSNAATETSFAEISGEVSVDYETREGNAHEGKDFKHTSGRLIFRDNECEQKIKVEIVDDFEYEADKDFYIILKNPIGHSASVGDPSVARVTIIDDDEPGELQFESPHFHGNTQLGILSVMIVRQNGCDGTVTLDISTTNGTAIGGLCIKKGVDFEHIDETVTFKHGEMLKTIDIKINKKSQKDKSFVITIKNPSLGAKVGENGGAICFIGEDASKLTLGTGTAENQLDERLAELIACGGSTEEEEELTWSGQFKAAMSIEEGKDEDGNPIDLTAIDFILHFCTFFWKVLCACIPPRKYLGAYPTFIFSLLVIGSMTIFIEQLGNLLGCVAGMHTAVAGITIVAIGTSLPDTFASRTAALHDQYADNSIGNITGSNSVNVFLGLGLPWVISTTFALVRGKKYCLSPDNLFQSVLLFVSLAATCLIFLVIRRVLLGGELGGKVVSKCLSGALLIFFWTTYVVIASLKAYNILPWNPTLPSSVCPIDLVSK